MREVIDIQAVKDCLAEVNDCEDKQYAIALLEWAIDKRTFDLDGHDSELLDKIAEKFIEWDSKVKGTREDEVCFFTIENILKVIEEMKAEVNE